MNPRLIESLKKLKEQQTVLENEIKRLQNEIKQMQIEMPEKIIDEAQEGLKNYSIINGYWHLDDENLGIKAEGVDGLPGKDGKDGRDGRDGRDGLNGLPGKMGLPGKDGVDGTPGKDGRDGKDGKDGIDGITPEFEVGEIKSVSTYDPAKVELIKNENKYIINMDIPRGRPGRDGKDGSNGSGGGGSSSGGSIDDVVVDGESVVSNGIANIEVTAIIRNVLIAYGLITGELTQREKEAINNMSLVIDENGYLLMDYDDVLLDINYSINSDGELLFTENRGLIDSKINNDEELEVIY